MLLLAELPHIRNMEIRVLKLSAKGERCRNPLPFVLPLVPGAVPLVLSLAGLFDY